MNDTQGLVDFHCHLDLYPNYTDEIRTADEAGVFTLAVTTTPRAWPHNNELAQKTKYVRAALGFHPHLVSTHEQELKIWDQYFALTRYIGEVGLDASPKYYSSFEAQKRVFKHILSRCAVSGDKIISVHSTRATKQVLDHIELYMPVNRGKVVLHWFTGSKSEAKRAIELGCYFSINNQMLKNQNGINLVKSLPIDRLLTETDGPFTKLEDRPMRPADTILTVKALENLHFLNELEIRNQIQTNLKTLLS
jgi:TatD DNase family protein